MRAIDRGFRPELGERFLEGVGSGSQLVAKRRPAWAGDFILTAQFPRSRCVLLELGPQGANPRRVFCKLVLQLDKHLFLFSGSTVKGKNGRALATWLDLARSGQVGGLRYWRHLGNKSAVRQRGWAPAGPFGVRCDLATMNRVATVASRRRFGGDRRRISRRVAGRHQLRQ